MNLTTGITIAAGASIAVGATTGVLIQRGNAGRVHEQWAEYQDIRSKLPESQRDQVKRPLSSVTPVWWTALPMGIAGTMGEIIGPMAGLPEMTTFGCAAAFVGAAFIGANVARALNHDPR
ncbi:MAG: hypothetical protein JWN72_2293 [Thermoleophilia bacterium]|nr:hypothetical protein [Thermoleophilia bacterium]